ncbi:MAG TPA: hypothetical protein DEQ38_08000 [Elusimicrobia bacterium]|nr:MAG: hypothetical protein A2089_06140 [Elusimicrobia bacterium GWD2_63_28]HCC48038.1 hypothetical protein [Elusimicrobiota bacterium]
MSELLKAYFNFHGCAVEYSTPDRDLASAISFDFAAFASPPCEPRIKLEALPQGLPIVLPPGRFKTRRWSVLESPPGRRLAWYPGGALCDYDYAGRSGTVLSLNRELLRELSYLLILSRAGEELDLRGLHRVHAAAAGFRGAALLFCGARGTGKTTLLLELLKETEFSLLSDDTPLADAAGRVHPFPARIGLGLDSPHLADFGGLRNFTRRQYPPKRLLDPAGAGFRISGALPAGGIFLLRRGGAPRIAPASPGAGAAELAVSLAAGYGTPQLAEYFLRLSAGDIAAKAGILFSRLRAAAALLRRARCYVFELGPDRRANAAELRSFLRSGSAGA